MRRQTLRSAALAVALCAPTTALAADVGPPVTPNPGLEMPASAAIFAAPEAAPTVAELIEEAKALKAAIDALTDDKATPRRFLWAGIIALIANLGLGVLKRVAQHYGKLTGKGKKAIPWITAGLSAVSSVAMYYIGGMTLFWAIFYGGATLGGLVLHELGIGIPSKKPPALATG